MGANLWQHVVVGMRRVLKSLVAVNDQFSHVFLLRERFGKGLKHQIIVIPLAKFVGHNLVVKQIFHS
ncbi:hypothetical protein PUW23_13105 [Paenibacillus urinalis]|uniref:Uncharacterized protein n=1 Tax=Paenibacillus urinalis TaxID=521520 RepID=A0AAX3MVR2_9BACL|nr:MULTISPECIES: hypothetical protein [Paenibacillus]WDH80505.1 hypothetical protein PUW23_13105 [Paenibacillus urinalis]